MTIQRTVRLAAVCCQILSFVFGFWAVASAQSDSKVTVEGRVFSATGVPLGGAVVTIAERAGANSSKEGLAGEKKAAAPDQAPGANSVAPPTATTGAAPATTAPAGTAPLASGQATYVAVTGSGSDAGHYSIADIPGGTYDITIAYDGYSSKELKSVFLSTAHQEIDSVLDASCKTCGVGTNQEIWPKSWLAWATFGIVIVFVFNIWAVRWNNIARPNREILKAEIDKAEARFKAETGLDLKKDDPKTSHLWGLLDAARRSTECGFSLLDFLFWSRGQEITGWSRIYEFQRDSINLLPPNSVALLRARLRALELDLLDIDKTHAKTLAGNIEDAVTKNPNDEPMLRATLVEALTYFTDESDNIFAQLVGWQTKAVWLVGVGCSLVVVLSFAIGNAVLFIAGAAGGYLSRLARQLKRADVPTDYGASWTTLFLSPVVGALSGWFGILLIVLLSNSKLALLGAAFQQVQWCCPLAPLTLGLAFALGFSERLFDGIISSLENKVDSDRKAATEPKQPNPPASPAPAAASAGGGGGR